MAVLSFMMWAQNRRAGAELVDADVEQRKLWVLGTEIGPLGDPFNGLALAE